MPGTTHSIEGQAYLTLVLQSPTLVTIRHGPIPSIDYLVQSLKDDKAPIIRHMVQIVYLILDDLTDLSVQVETEVRDQILLMAKTLTEDPGVIHVGDLSKLRRQVDQLVSLIENQLYCIAGLNASDNEVLQEPHRKAYIQDLLSEVEIAQRGIYRLEIILYLPQQRGITNIIALTRSAYTNQAFLSIHPPKKSKVAIPAPSLKTFRLERFHKLQTERNLYNLELKNILSHYVISKIRRLTLDTKSYLRGGNY